MAPGSLTQCPAGPLESFIPLLRVWTVAGPAPLWTAADNDPPGLAGRGDAIGPSHTFHVGGLRVWLISLGMMSRGFTTGRPVG